MTEKKDCSFFLKDPKSITPTWINFHMTCPDDTVKRSIKEKILPAEWDFEAQRAIGNTKPSRAINQVIDSIVTMLPGIKSECRRNNRVISSADVNAAIDVILQDKRPEKEKAKAPGRDMFADFKAIIQGMKDGTILTPGKKKKKYADATIKNFDKSVKKIQMFYVDRKLPAVIQNVTISTYNDFITWCHADDQSNNSIGVFVKCWKRLGKITFDRDWHSNKVFEKEEFMILKEDTDDIYLDETKIERIYNQVVPADHYDIARDWFVLDCYLGLRVSDLGQISMKDFAGNTFQFVNHKTGAQVAIPIHRFVKAIIKKYKGLPPAMTDVNLNAHIKIVAKMAGIKDKFIYTITKGGELQTHEMQEWQMVSSHTCRRSFITNLLKLGIPHARVMKLAGIKRYETLMRYFKESAVDAAKEVGKHDYYK